MTCEFIPLEILEPVDLSNWFGLHDPFPTNYFVIYLRADTYCRSFLPHAYHECCSVEAGCDLPLEDVGVVLIIMLSKYKKANTSIRA